MNAPSTSIVWNARAILSPRGRAIARGFADRALASIGSIKGAIAPSRSVAITFDDGPDPHVTPAVLDLLSRHGVAATFFLLTDRVHQNEDLIRRMASEGHEIALHADHHERFTTVPGAELRRRLGAAKELLERVAGQRVRFFRPPFGAQSISSYLSARACGLEVVVWGPYAEDWVEGTPEIVAARALSNVQQGDILLLHDGLEMPPGEAIPAFDRVEAFDLILAGFQRRQLEPVTVGRLIAEGGARRTAWFRP